jgi:hypothetical protein
VRAAKVPHRRCAVRDLDAIDETTAQGLQMHLLVEFHRQLASLARECRDRRADSDCEHRTAWAHGHYGTDEPVDSRMG